jgi:hypothetical protein
MADDVAGLNYRLVLQSSDKIIEEDIADFSQPVERSVDTGSWTVGVFAYTGDNKTAWGSTGTTPIQVLEGETKAVPITLLPVTDQDAAGIFDYDIDFPAPTPDFDYDSATLKLTPVSSSTNSAPSGEISINLLDPDKDVALLELPAGRYTLDITLTSMRQIYSQALKVTWKETVYLYPGLTTQAHKAFTEAQFAADVYLKGTAKVYNHTETNANGDYLVNYIPTEVQIKLYDDPSGDPDDTNIQEAPITQNEETGDYEWDLLVSLEKINSAGNANQVNLRFVIADKTDATKTLTGALETVSLSNFQGKTNVSLSTNVYSIVKGTNAYFSAGTGIKGLSGIAHDKHAIASTDVKLRIVPRANYGVIGSQISITNGYNQTVAPDGTVSFTMQPSGNATVNAGFFHLAGTAEIYGTNTDNYVVKKVEAWGDVENEETGTYTWELIGSTTNIAANHTWTITGFGDHVYTGASGSIRFKVYMEATGKTPLDYTTTVYVGDLTGTDTATLHPTLYTVSNFHQTGATLNSVTLSWDAAPWATGGFNVYRYDSGWVKITSTPLTAATTSYINNTGLTAGTSYSYYIVGLYGTPPVEGQSASVSASTQLAAPLSVNAETNPTSDYPFQTYITWSSVTGANYYEVYRNGTSVGSNTSDTYYYDSYAYKTPGEVYTYKVVAKSWSGDYDITSADSAPDTVSFPAPSTNQSGYISSSATFNYHRFTASDSGYYNLSFSTGYSFDAYAYVYVNGSQYSSFYLNGGMVGLNANAGDEMIVAVRANNFSSTGSYYINIDQ